MCFAVPYYCDFSTECVLQDSTDYYDWTVGQPQGVQPRTGNFGCECKLSTRNTRDSLLPLHFEQSVS